MVVAAVLVLFSGCAALVFQVAWMRELRLVFGSTTASVSAVLAIFMGGLGVGSAVIGPRADRSPNPLRMYGLLEVAIALSVAVSPWLIDLVSWIYIGLGGQQSLGLVGASLVRLLLTAVVMSVPTFLMGGTLPAVVRAVTASEDLHRRALGTLYGSNTLGAVAGTVLATFFALETLGTRATLWAGCALGFAAGGLAIRLARQWQHPLPDTRQATASTKAQQEADEEISAALYPGLAYTVAAVLGFTFFALEIVWYRMLAPILGGTTFTFGLILAVALLGIGAGGLAYNLLFYRFRPSWNALALTCGLEAVFSLLPYALGDRLAVLAAWYGQDAEQFGDLIYGWLVVTSIVVLPTALISGVQFPLLIALLGQGRTTVSRHLGMTYAWNTIGAIAGSLGAGFGALPLLGAPAMWLMLGGILLALSLLVLLANRERSRWATAGAIGVTLLTSATMFATGPTAAWRHSGIGAGRAIIASFAPNGIEYWRNAFRDNVVWEADGVEASIGIKCIHGYDFVVNGKTDGNSLNDAPTQVGVAILGAMLHPDPQTGLVIGLGTGQSVGWFAEMRGVRHVDVVELEPAIDEMASKCASLNFDVLNNPKVERVYNDGREFVLTTDNQYDVIISEPSNPYRAGVATLYTKEFYRSARERLHPGGVFIQFLQAYEIDDATIQIVLATVRSAFRHVEVWQTSPSDLQLVCSDTPLEYSAEDLSRRMEDPTLNRALKDVWNCSDLEGFLSHFVASADWVTAVAERAEVPLNTDDCTVLEYTFAKTVGRATPFSIEQLRNSIVGAGNTRPAIASDSIDWREVELHRQLINAASGGQFSVALLPRQEDQALVRALIHFRANQFEQALSYWPADHWTVDAPLARLVKARCYAELGREECLETLEGLDARYAGDAAAIHTIYGLRSGDLALTENGFASFVEALQFDPWTIAVFSDTAFSRAIDLAKADRQAAERIFPLLAEPFAAHQFDYIRRMSRWLIAKEIGPEKAVEALAPLEPHVPWTAELLQLRAEAYRQTNHPLAETAADDWQRYQQQAE